MILYARRMVRRGQSYAVDLKHSIDLKTQFVAHVSIRYSVLPRPSFINKCFRLGLDVSSGWEEKAGIHFVHSVVEDAVEQNSWGKSGSDRMCRFQNNGELHRTSGDAPLETPDVGERAGIHSVSTNDFVC